jgi:hypothetical protein
MLNWSLLIWNRLFDTTNVQDFLLRDLYVVVDEKLPRFDHAKGKWHSCYSKPFFCVSYSKTKQDKKTANISFSWPPSRGSLPMLREMPSVASWDSTEPVNMHHIMRNDLFFYVVFFFFWIILLSITKIWKINAMLLLLLISRRRPAFLRRDFLV